MLTGVTDGFFCCLLGTPPNAVWPLESVESSDGYTFVEVKPGRVLRVKHAGPAPVPTPPPPPPEDDPGVKTGLVRCQRRITVYRNGRLVVENLGRAPRANLQGCSGSKRQQRDVRNHRSLFSSILYELLGYVATAGAQEAQRQMRRGS